MDTKIERMDIKKIRKANLAMMYMLKNVKSKGNVDREDIIQLLNNTQQNFLILDKYKYYKNK